MLSLPRFILAGASSGSGKTSLCLGLLAAFRGSGLEVRPFKVGPDYIDPALHEAAAGLPSRNLDPRLMGRAGVLASLVRGGQGAGLALLEGVMGYYDAEGLGASTFDLARLTDTPVILCVDASGAAESVAATAFGFLRYRRGSRIAGFLANRIGGAGHLELVKRAIEARTGLPLLGGLSADPSLALPERHLGLVDPRESPDFAAALAALREAVERGVDLAALTRIAGAAPPLAEPPPSAQAAAAGADSPMVAYADDEAFRFRYADNLDILRGLGCRLVPFSPLRDSRLPEGADALYLCGGYPELHARRLSENCAMRDSVRAAAAAGLPVLAECGGYLYLLEELGDAEGRSWPACGLAPGRSVLGKRLADLGYREAELRAAGPLGPAGTRLRGHVFHYARVEGAEAGAPAVDWIGGRHGSEGFASGSVFASFLHVHFAGNPRAARAFAAAARAHRRMSRPRRSPRLAASPGPG